MSGAPGPRLARDQARMSDGICLSLLKASPDQQPVGTILALHGIQSHSGWYHRSVDQLAEAGWEVHFADRRGSGLSQGPRGHADHWQRLVNDVVTLLDRLQEQRSRGPLVLLAVSWGGKLAAAVAALRPDLLDGLVLMCPGICPKVRPGPKQRALLWLTEQLGGRRRPVLIPLEDPTLFTHDPGFQQFLREDPLSVRVTSTGFLIASRALDQMVRKSPCGITTPVLLMLAGKDRIIDNEATRSWFGRIGAERKRLVEFVNAAHTFEFDSCREAAVQELLAWLNSLTPKA